eukprot:m.95378 g.95378  ORF g.95378 m.95378 type:complete len:332 (+) comp36849_c0_seq2:115-1110(+)
MVSCRKTAFLLAVVVFLCEPKSEGRSPGPPFVNDSLAFTQHSTAFTQHSTGRKTTAAPSPWPGITLTCGGTAPLDSPCQFPFKYNQKEYTQCTTNGSVLPWCATQPDDYESHRLWGFCNCTGKVFEEQCQVYESGGTCGPYRQNQIVLVSNQYPPSGVLSLVDRVSRLFKPLVREGDEKLCSEVFTTFLCYNLFPSCHSVEPGGRVTDRRICREVCFQVLHGNCSSFFVRGFLLLQSFYEYVNYEHLSFIHIGVPRCGELPLKTENPDCTDINVDLGFEESILSETISTVFSTKTTDASSSSPRNYAIVASAAATASTFGCRCRNNNNNAS